jgi:Rrf2 family protein
MNTDIVSVLAAPGHRDVAQMAALLPLVQLPIRVLDGLAVCTQLASGEQQDMGSISQMQRIPSRRLELALSALLRAGIVVSRRGRLGGYRLTRPASEVRVLDIFAALRPEGVNGEWSLPRSVEVSTLTRQLEAMVEQALAGVTLADLTVTSRS